MSYIAVRFFLFFKKILGPKITIQIVELIYKLKHGYVSKYQPLNDSMFWDILKKTQIIRSTIFLLMWVLNERP